MKPTALFIVGSARSGTSALTRTLSLCGGTLPGQMMGGLPGNPLGYWEPRKAIHLNATILRRHGSSIHDPSLRLQSADLDSQLGQVTDYMASLPAAPVVVVKDVQITALRGLWFEAARAAGFRVAAVIALRHPAEVNCSLRVLGEKGSPELAAALWLKYTLLAERYSRGIPRTVVEFSNLLDDWRLEVKRISAALDVDLHTDNAGAVEGFLRADQRHHRASGPVPQTFGMGWSSTVYRELHDAANDEPWDLPTLDHVLEMYESSEYGFRSAFEGYRRLQKSRIPPCVSRVALELAALMHRRRGSWA